MASEKFFPYPEIRQNIARQFDLILLVSDCGELKSDAGYAVTAAFWFSVTRCAICNKIMHSNRAIQYTLYVMSVRAVKESEFKVLLRKNMYSAIKNIAGIIRMEGIVISRSYNYLPGRNRKVLVLSF